MKSSRLFYISPIFIVLVEPGNGIYPVVVLRHPGVPDESEMKKLEGVLKLCEMELEGEPYIGDDSFWRCQVKEVSNGGEELPAKVH